MHIVARNGVYCNEVQRIQPFVDRGQYKPSSGTSMKEVRGYMVLHSTHAGITTIDVMGEGIGFEDIGRSDAWQQFHQWANNKEAGKAVTHTLVPEPDKKQRNKIGKGRTAEDIFREKLAITPLPTQRIDYKSVQVQYSGYGGKWRVRYGPRYALLNYPGAYTSVQVAAARKKAWEMINEEIAIRAGVKKEIQEVRQQELDRIQGEHSKRAEAIRTVYTAIWKEETVIARFRAKLQEIALPRKLMKVKNSHYRFHKNKLNGRAYEVYLSTTVQKKKVYAGFGFALSEEEAQQSSLIMIGLINEAIGIRNRKQTSDK